jgi:hypothetical protein
MANKQDNTPKIDPNYPTFGESMRDITGIIGKNPTILTDSKPIFDEKGKRVFRQFTDDKGVLSEMDQKKSKKKVLTGLK